MGKERLTAQLRFVSRDGARILQQAIERKEWRELPGDALNAHDVWVLDRWQDVPLVDEA